MEDFGSETDSEYTSYWRDWVSEIFIVANFFVLVGCLIDMICVSKDSMTIHPELGLAAPVSRVAMGLQNAWLECAVKSCLVIDVVTPPTPRHARQLSTHFLRADHMTFGHAFAGFDNLALQSLCLYQSQ